MTLFRPSVMWVFSGDDTRSRGTAGVRGQVRMFKGKSLFGQTVDVWGADGRVPIGPTVIPIHVVGDDDHEIVFFCQAIGFITCNRSR